MRRLYLLLPLAAIVLVGCVSAGALATASGGPAALIRTSNTAGSSAGAQAAPVIASAVSSFSQGTRRQPTGGGAQAPAAAPAAVPANGTVPTHQSLVRSGGLLPRIPNPGPGPIGCLGPPSGGRAIPMCELK